MSEQPTLWDSLAATSSAASADGSTPCTSPDGPTTEKHGPGAVPASHSRARASSGRTTTKDISGPCSFGSLESAALQRVLVNKLQALLEGAGSPEYALTWKRLAMPSGPPICALLAWAHRTSGSGFSGWPSPQARDHFPPHTQDYLERKRRECNNAGGFAGDLPDVAAMAGWGTPSARDHKDAGPAFEADPSIVEVESRLPWQAALAGWPTPTAGSGEGGDQSDPVKALERMRSGRSNLDDAACLASGDASTSSTAGTEKRGESRGVLNPAFSLWLMGFPWAWVECGRRAMRGLSPSRKARKAASESSEGPGTPSTPKSPPCSSVRFSKRKAT